MKTGVKIMVRRTRSVKPLVNDGRIMHGETVCVVGTYSLAGLQDIPDGTIGNTRYEGTFLALSGSVPFGIDSLELELRPGVRVGIAVMNCRMTALGDKYQILVTGSIPQFE